MREQLITEAGATPALLVTEIQKSHIWESGDAHGRPTATRRLMEKTPEQDDFGVKILSSQERITNLPHWAGPAWLPADRGPRSVQAAPALRTAQTAGSVCLLYSGIWVSRINQKPFTYKELPPTSTGPSCGLWVSDVSAPSFSTFRTSGYQTG